MWLRPAPYTFLLIIAGTQTISCEEKGSLTYVIDNTLSMTDDIKQIKRNTDVITKTVFEESSSQIKNMVLVTFNDPYAVLETITDSKDVFKAKINQVHVHNNYGNNDCQEMSLTGILLALEKSLPRSFIYVFTDASAKDYEKSSQIQKMCQQKQTQIVFVLTGYCKWDRYKPSFQVYYDIAAACSGLAFVVSKHEVSSIFTPIKDIIKGKKGMITSRAIPAHTLQVIQFDVDDNTEYVRVEAAGFDVTLSVKGPKPHANWWTYYKKKLTWLPNIKVLLLTRLNPGRYSATVYGFSRTVVNIIGNSDFSFELGFSESETTSLKNTTAQPVANSSTRLFISVSDPNKAMNIQSARILDMDENDIANFNIPLTRISNNYYSTPLFTAPSEMFKIAVYGKSTNTGKLIRHLARFPITPQPAKKKPVVTITEGAAILSRYGQSLSLTCNVTAYPEPAIEWTDSQQNILQSRITVTKAPYNYASFLTIPEVTENEIYSCRATNDMGTDNRTINIMVEDPFHIHSPLNDSMQVKYGAKATLKCDITASQPIHISWTFIDINKRERRQIRSSENYSVSTDGSTLKINKMTTDTVGTYICIAMLNKNKNKFKSHSTEVRLVGLTSPKITSDSSTVYRSIEGQDRILTIPCTATGLPKPTITWKLGNRILRQSAKYSFEDDALVIKNPTVEDTGSYVCSARNVVGSTSTSFIAEILQIPETSGEITKIVRAGASTDIKCMVAKGVPAPTISWQFMGNGELKFRKLIGSDSVIHISPVGEKDAGRYKCTAHNIVGDAEHITVLIVKVPPVIMSDNSTVHKAVEGQDKILKIPCKATGLPKPIISWRTRNEFIPSNEKYSFEDDALLIKGPTTNDSGSYVCVATNEAGSISFPLYAQILQVPQMAGETSKVVKVGMSLSIECTIVKGVPTPTITWQFRAKDKSKFERIKGSDNVLRISTVGEGNAGHYKCIAHNTIGDAEHITNVIVQVPPIIKSGNSSVYKAVETQDATLRLPCKAIGLPKPNVTWTLGHKIISPDTKYSFENGDLIIENPVVDDAATYVCTASNEAGTSNVSVEAQILQIPQTSNETSMSVTVGSSTSVKCMVTKGVPAPTITWQFKSKGVTNFIQLANSDHVLHIPRVDEKDTGRYKCTAHNIVGDAEHVTILTVQVPPMITSNYSTVYTFVEEQDKALRIPCTTSGLPKPTITWTVKQETISPSVKYSFEDNTLIIKDPVVNDTGTYVCAAKNDAGSVNASFNVQIYQMPQISGETSKIVRAGNVLDIECVIVKGVPAPKITWQFMAKNESKFVPIAGSDNVLHISAVSNGNAGRYKCIAENVLGVAEHVTAIVVEFAPNVITNISEAFEGLEGDVALRIPCNVIGVPPPVISWSVNGTAISTNPHYSVTDGALIIISPKNNDTGSYRCEASNYLGSVNISYNAIVKEHLDDRGKIEQIKINKVNRTSFKLECGSPGQSVRWFIEGIDTEVNGNYFELNDFDAAYNGNYTCRVSDMFGAYTKTYHVNIGSPPEFAFAQEETTLDWTGYDKNVLDCSVGPADRAKIEWTYNGEVLSENTTLSLGVIRKWGQYTCNVSNDFGAIQRTFDVISSLCLIPRNPKEYGFMPLMLNEDDTWPILRFTSKYFTFESGDEIKLSCPYYETERNSLRNFPALQEIIAKCDKQDIFIVQGKPYKVYDLGCDHAIIPTVVNKNETCSPDPSNKISIGYNVSTFLETYEVCLDSLHNIPLYSRIIMPINYYGEDVNNIWYMHPAINFTANDEVYTCENSASTCCYSKTQLISAEYVIDGPAQNTTFIDTINEVPLWRPCNETKSFWNYVDEQIMFQLNLVPASIIWSGAHAYQNQNGHLVPRYLFKLVEFIENSPIAVVYVNGPSPTAGDVLCKNICADGDQIWLEDLGDHVYCCTGDDFREAFKFYPETIN